MNPYICRIVMLTYQNDRYHQTSRHRGKHRGKQIADTDYTNLRLRGMQGERLLHVSRCARNANGTIRDRCVYLPSWRCGMGGGTPFSRTASRMLGFRLSAFASIQLNSFLNKLFNSSLD